MLALAEAIVSLTVEAELSRGRQGQPITVAPDIAHSITPELAIAVVDGHRGRGVGTALLAAVHARARADGIDRISLSVDHDNPARRLYERLGYVALAEREDDDRMVLELH